MTVSHPVNITFGFVGVKEMALLLIDFLNGNPQVVKTLQFAVGNAVGYIAV